MNGTSLDEEPAQAALAFGDFWLDLLGERLWRGHDVVFLRPKAWSVLRHLAEHAGRMVSTAELLDAAWPDAVVTPNVLTNVIGELRAALDDRGPSPRYIQTVHRRGYRFVAEVRDGPPPAGFEPDAPTTQSARAGNGKPIFIGRATEIEELRARWRLAASGERQVIFLAGEPGIGKTTLVDAFTTALAGEPSAGPGLLRARAQCVEQHGAREPYHPLLEALEQLAAGAERGRVLALLRTFAPTWLAQIPWLVAAEELRGLERSLMGSGSARMLREGARLIEALAEDVPLLLVLEDLHWSDVHTLDVIAALAARATPARLLVLASYRPVDAVVQGHPIVALARAMRQRGQATEIALAPFNAEETRAYLERRFESAGIASRLCSSLEQQSAGNPLFVCALAAHVVARGWVRKRDGAWEVEENLDASAVGLPDDLRGAIEAQLATLPKETRQALEVASVEGVEFSAGVVAAGLECAADAVDDRFHELAMLGQLVRVASPAEHGAPDGGSYRFVHALYRKVLYDRLAPSRRKTLHRRLGAHLEQLHGAQPDDVAGRLLAHFEAAGDLERIVRYLEQVALNAMRRHAHDDAIVHFQSAIQALQRLPESAARAQREALLQLSLGNALILSQGYNEPRAGEAFGRAEILARSAGAHRERFRALLGLSTNQSGAGNAHERQPIVEQLIALAAESVPELDAQAHWQSAELLLAQGDFTTARLRFAQCVRMKADPAIPALLDLRAAANSRMALVLMHLGLLEQALVVSDAACRRADESGLPLSAAFTRAMAAELGILMADPARALGCANELAALAERYAFLSDRTMGEFYRCWALQQTSPSIALARDMHRAVQRHNALGERWHDSVHLAQLVVAYAQCGEMDSAMQCLSAAFDHVEWSGERRHEAELHRLRGELLLGAQDPDGLAVARSAVASPPARRRPAAHGARRSVDGCDRDQAEACFERALEVARRQGAKLWELRATMSLCRSLGERRETGRALEMLSAVYGEFSEGLATYDLRSARSLLEELRV